MGSGGQDDIIAHIRAQFDTQSLKISLGDVVQGFKLLKEAANSSLNSDILKKYAFDMGGLALAVEALGHAYEKANDTEKALALAANAQEKNFQANVAAQRKAKQDEIDLNDQANQKMIAMNRAYFGQIDQQRKLNQQAVNAEEDAEQQAYAKADAAKVISARQASQAIIDIQKQQAAQVLAAQKSLYSSLQQGASGNIGGMLGGIMQQAMAGTLPNAQSGGLGGILGAGGAGLTSTLGLSADLAPVVGGVTLLGQATLALGTAYLKAYNSSQDFLGNLRLIQKEMGTTATQTSQLTSFMGLTQNPNSPFSVIVFQQVAANLQNLSDIDKGMSEATGMSAGQINKMRDELKKLNVDIYDSKREVKDITQFTLDLNKAMQGLSPGRYAQAGQAIGGLFGKDFMAVVGTAPDQLQKLADSAVVVTQQMLNLAEARKVAYAISTNAEQQFNIELTKTLIPLDLQIQAQKQLFLMREALVLQAGGTIFDNIANQVRLDAMTPSQVMDEWKRNNAGTPQEQAAQDQNAKSLKRATDDYKFVLKEIGLVLDAGVLSQKNYTTALGDMTTALGKASTAAGQLNTLNDKSISGFDTTLNGVLSNAKGYDSYYKSLKGAQETVDKLDKQSNTNVQYSYYVDPKTGETIQPTSSKAMKTYTDALQKAGYQDQYDEVLKQGEIGTKKLLDQQANERAGTGTSRTTVNAKGVSKTTTVGGKGATNAQLLGQQQAIDNLTNGTPTDAARAQVEQMKLDVLAEAAGLPAGTAPTMENFKTGWTKAGLSASQQDQRQNALEQIQQLNFSDKDSQLKTMAKSASDFLKTISAQPATLDQVDAKNKEFGDTALVMAQNLQGFAKSAGMFDSVGFTRSMGEAALAADLANGKFGVGKEALQAYFDKMKEFEGITFNLKDVLAGTYNITAKQAIDNGLATEVDPTAVAGVKTDTATAARLKKLGEGTGVSGAGAVGQSKTLYNKNLMDKIAAGQLGPNDVMQLIADKEKMDTQAGIMGMYDQNFTAAKDKADQLLKTIDDSATTIFAKMHELNVEISDKSMQGISDKLAALGLAPAPGATKAVKNAVDIGKMWGIDFTSTDIPGIKSEIKQRTTDLSGPNPVIPLPFMDINTPITPTLPTTPTALPIGGFPSALDPVLGLPAAGPVAPEGGLATSSINDQVKKALSEIQRTTVDTNPLLAKQEVDMSAGAKAAREVQVMGARAAMQAVLANNPLYIQVITTTTSPAPAGPAGPPAPPPAPPPAGILPPPFPTRDIGGSVTKNNPVWIGVNGQPEIFWPGADGYIIDAAISRRLAAQNSVPVNVKQPAFIFNASSPTNNIQIDARGADSPATTAWMVRNAAETFMSNDPSVVARAADRRKGYL